MRTFREWTRYTAFWPITALTFTHFTSSIFSTTAHPGPMRFSFVLRRHKMECVEPVSKLFEEDNEAGKLDKAEEIVGVVLPSNEDPALPLNPSEEALDEPASHLAAQPSPIL